MEEAPSTIHIENPYPSLTHPAQEGIYQRFGVSGLKPPVTAVGDDFFPKASESFPQGIVAAYPWTTENLAEYMPQLDLQGKRVIAIIGGADFIIDAYMRGAAQVTGVDISPGACLYAELKLAALHSLNYDQFLQFFGLTSYGTPPYSEEAYRKLRTDLSPSARGFFDSLVRNVSTEHTQTEMVSPGRRELDVDRILIKSIPGRFAQTMTGYLQNANNYEVAQRAVKPTKLYPASMENFIEIALTNNKYDMAYLSNILSYRNSTEADIISGMRPLLVDGGRMVFLYFYGMRDTSPQQMDNVANDAHSRVLVLQRQYKLDLRRPQVVASGYNNLEVQAVYELEIPSPIHTAHKHELALSTDELVDDTPTKLIAAQDADGNYLAGVFAGIENWDTVFAIRKKLLRKGLANCKPQDLTSAALNDLDRDLTSVDSPQNKRGVSAIIQPDTANNSSFRITLANSGGSAYIFDHQTQALRKLTLSESEEDDLGSKDKDRERYKDGKHTLSWIGRKGDILCLFTQRVTDPKELETVLQGCIRRRDSVEATSSEILESETALERGKGNIKIALIKL